MIKKIIGGIVAGFIVFIWSALSWMVLPLHQKTLHSFNLETVVQLALTTNTHGSGIYVLPGMGSENLSAQDKKGAEINRSKQMEKGPFAFLVMKREGVGSMNMLMIRALMVQILAGLLMVLLLSLARIESYLVRVGFVVLTALLGGILCHLPNWIWWGFPPNFTLLAMLDLAISWFLAGLVLAQCCSRKKAYSD